MKAMLSILYITFLSSCVVRHEQPINQLTHKIGSPAIKGDSWGWYDVKNKPAGQIVKNLYEEDNQRDIQDVFHPATEHLQSWLSLMDKTVREHFPNKLSHIPPPFVRVGNFRAATAVKTRVCIPSKIEVLDLKNKEETSDKKNQELEETPPLYIGMDIYGYVFLSPSQVCITDKNYQPHLPKIVEHINKSHPRCKMKFQEDTLIIDYKCLGPEPPPFKIVSSNFSLVLMSNLIIIPKTYLEYLDEKAVVATLAHELSHYYRAHYTLSNFGKEHFYIHQMKNPNHRPIKDPTAEKLGNSIISNTYNNPRSSKLKELFLEAQKTKLGYYTYEQEADDLSLEILALVGVNPQVSIDAYYQVLQIETVESNPLRQAIGLFNAEECRQLHENNWLSPAGQLVIPMGTYLDKHHSRCYNIFNLDRESKTHNYQIQPLKKTFLSKSEWQKIIQSKE